MRHSFLIGLTAALFSATAYAQLEMPKSTPEAQESAVRALMDLARKNLPKTHLPDGSPMPAETEEDLKKPVVPVEDAKRVMKDSAGAAIIEWCQLDPKPTYMKFMHGEYKKHIWSDKQIIYMGLLYGMSQDILVHEWERRKGACTDDERDALKRDLKNMGMAGADAE